MEQAAKIRAEARALLWGDDTYGKFLFGEMILGCLGFLLAFVVGACLYLFNAVVSEATRAKLSALASMPGLPDASQLEVLKEFLQLLTPQEQLLGGGLCAVVLLALCYLIGFESWGSHAMSIASVRRGLRVAHALSGWGHGWRMACLAGLQLLYVALWGCLLVVPGVRKLFGYVLAPYLLVDHPDWPLHRCLAESERLMDGQRLAFFKLAVSFFGWYLAVYLAQRYLRFVGKFAQTLLAPYPEAAFALFYEARLDADQPLPAAETPAESPAEQPTAEPAAEPPAETTLYSQDEYDQKDEEKKA